jgi:putative addiction module component (TIGR02574 family)
MSVPVFEVEDAAMALSDAQRADLAYKLLRSLPPASGSDADSPAFETELERRMAAYDAGQTTADDWDVVRGRLQAVLEKRLST